MKKKILIVLLMGAFAVNFHFISNLSAGEGGGASDNVEFKQLNKMKEYTNFMVYFINTLGEPNNAIGIAQNSLKDLYVGQNKPEKAIEVLEKATIVVTDAKKRNVIRFTLAELYKQTNQTEKAQEQLLKIIMENASL